MARNLTRPDWAVVGLSPKNDLLLEGPFASREDASAYAKKLTEGNPRDWRFWAQVLRIPEEVTQTEGSHHGS